MIVDYIDDLLRQFKAIIYAKTEEEKVGKTIDSDLVLFFKIFLFKNIVFDLDSFHCFVLINKYQASIRKKWVEEQAPPMLEKLEEIVKQNKGGDGWLVGDNVSKRLNNNTIVSL